MENKDLVLLSKARQQLLLARDLPEIKQIKDVAKATLAYAKAKGLSKEIQDEAGVLIIEAGIEFSKMKRIGQQAGEIKTQATAKSSSKKELDNFGVKKKESYINDQFAKDEKVTLEIIDDLRKQDIRVTEGAVLREIKIKEREIRNDNLQPIELPEGEYGIIYADPPWEYDFSETTGREIENKYPTMELEDIKNMGLPSADNCLLFLWATAPKLPEALEVLNAWGFTYRTCAVWDKEIIGMGYWFRGQHELLLVGVKGEFKPPEQSKRVSSVHRERRGKHSKKPNYYYDLIEECYPNGKYLELFAREKHNDKWSVYGNEVE